MVEFFFPPSTCTSVCFCFLFMGWLRLVFFYQFCEVVAVLPHINLDYSMGIKALFPGVTWGGGLTLTIYCRLLPTECMELYLHPLPL